LARTGASLLGLGLVLAGGRAAAQQPLSNDTSGFVTNVSGAQPTPPSDTKLVQRGMGGRGFGGGTSPFEQEASNLSVPLEPPGPERLFRLESEQNWMERVEQEHIQGPEHDRVEFPEEPPISNDRYQRRNFPPATEVVEPNYLCYKRLYFEQLNAERYGWDLGIIHPIVSAGIFFWDVALLPYHCGTEPFRKYECSAGYCLPGDPVPLLLYPVEFSLTGTVLEAGTIVSLFAIFPG